MDTVFKKINILILKGVYPKDFGPIDAVYEKLEYNSMVYTNIPKKFTTPESWPRVSNLKCWECDQLFHTYPKFIPTCPEKDGDNDTAIPLGNFCEWNCAVLYVYKNYPTNQQPDILKMICLIAGKFARRRILKIMPSPNKTIMKQYCGDEGLTPQQYKESIAMLNAEYELGIYKLEQFKAGE